jgi:hypothetical protein
MSRFLRKKQVKKQAEAYLSALGEAQANQARHPSLSGALTKANEKYLPTRDDAQARFQDPRQHQADAYHDALANAQAQAPEYHEEQYKHQAKGKKAQAQALRQANLLARAGAPPPAGAQADVRLDANLQAEARGHRAYRTRGNARDQARDRAKAKAEAQHQDSARLTVDEEAHLQHLLKFQRDVKDQAKVTSKKLKDKTTFVGVEEDPDYREALVKESVGTASLTDQFERFNSEVTPQRATPIKLENGYTAKTRDVSSRKPPNQPTKPIRLRNHHQAPVQTYGQKTAQKLAPVKESVSRVAFLTAQLEDLKDSVIFYSGALAEAEANENYTNYYVNGNESNDDFQINPNDDTIPPKEGFTPMVSRGMTSTISGIMKGNVGFKL